MHDFLLNKWWFLIYIFFVGKKNLDFWESEKWRKNRRRKTEKLDFQEKIKIRKISKKNKIKEKCKGFLILQIGLIGRIGRIRLIGLLRLKCYFIGCHLQTEAPRYQNSSVAEWRSRLYTFTFTRFWRLSFLKI